MFGLLKNLIKKINTPKLVKTFKKMWIQFLLISQTCGFIVDHSNPVIIENLIKAPNFSRVTYGDGISGSGEYSGSGSGNYYGDEYGYRPFYPNGDLEVVGLLDYTCENDNPCQNGSLCRTARPSNLEAIPGTVVFNSGEKMFFYVGVL